MRPDAPASLPRVRWLWAAPLYVLLTLIGVLTAQPAYSLLALALLVGAIAWPALRRSVRARLIGIGIALVAFACLWFGVADAVLDALPVVVNAALAWLFADSLRRGREPLIARFVRIIEGPERLDDPALLSYTRGLTRAWAVLLALQALLLGAIWLVSLVPAIGHLFNLGAGRSHWLHVYARLGCYLTIALFFTLEYAWRRWHLRHLPHSGFFAFLARIVQRWPDMLHDAGQRVP